jgi:hypothetical protein
MDRFILFIEIHGRFSHSNHELSVFLQLFFFENFNAADMIYQKIQQINPGNQYIKFEITISGKDQIYFHD